MPAKTIREDDFIRVQYYFSLKYRVIASNIRVIHRYLKYYINWFHFFYTKLKFVYVDAFFNFSLYRLDTLRDLNKKLDDSFTELEENVTIMEKLNMKTKGLETKLKKLDDFIDRHHGLARSYFRTYVFRILFFFLLDFLMIIAVYGIIILLFVFLFLSFSGAMNTVEYL